MTATKQRSSSTHREYQNMLRSAIRDRKIGVSSLLAMQRDIHKFKRLPSKLEEVLHVEIDMSKVLVLSWKAQTTMPFMTRYGLLRTAYNIFMNGKNRPAMRGSPLFPFARLLLKKECSDFNLEVSAMRTLSQSLPYGSD